STAQPSVEDIWDGQSAARVAAEVNVSIVYLEILRGTLELAGHRFEELVTDSRRREPHRIAHVVSTATARRDRVVRRYSGIRVHDGHARGLEAEHLGDNLRKDRVTPLSHLDRARQDAYGCIGVEVDHGAGYRWSKDRLHAYGDALPVRIPLVSL